MKELREKLAALWSKYDERKKTLEAAKTISTPEAETELTGMLNDIDAMQKRIELADREERARQFAGASVENPIRPEPNDPLSGIAVNERQKPFKSVGEMLQRMVKVARGQLTDHRLDGCRVDQETFDIPADATFEKRGSLAMKAVEKRTAGTGGLVESTGAAGGQLVGTDVDDTLISTAWDNTQLLPLMDNRTISAASNSQKLHSVYETSRADGSRQGGVRVYTDAELDALTQSKPTFMDIELKLNALTGLLYCSDEELEDVPWLEGSVNDMFANEFAFKLQDLVVNGTGAGQALGILKSPALVSVTKESGQAADTIKYKNINKMWSRALGMRSRMVWLVNSDTLPELEEMTIVGGTASSPVFVPPRGAADAPLGTLKGRPIIEIEQAQTLGDLGDIILVDPFAYVTATKGGIKSAVSIHLKFDYRQTTFRFVMRFDGRPKVSSAVTPFTGTATKSPFVAIAERA